MPYVTARGLEMTMQAKANAIFATVLFGFATLFGSSAQAKTDDDLTYRVKAGDTFYGLADQYLRGRAAWSKVASLNTIRDPRALQADSVIRIPRALLRYEAIPLRVKSFSGPALVAKQTAVLGSALTEGDRVETGTNGFISFEGSRSTVVSLPSNTKARLVTARRYLLGSTLDIDFEILEGRGEVLAPKLKRQERFRVRTPVAVTAVRGTVFRVGHDPASEKSVAEVAEGAVAVEAASQSLVAESGFGVPLSADGVGELERLLPGAAIVDPGAVQTNENVRFTVTALDGAARYRTQIAKDAGFLEIVGEKLDAQTVSTFGDLPNGTYFVRSRSISGTGVEGVSDIYAFKRKRLGVSAGAEKSELEDGFKFSWLPESDDSGDSNITFAFQLWNQEAATAPIVDEIGIEGAGFVVTGLKPGTYLWRVAAVEADADGLLKIWAPAQKLNITD